MLECVINLAEGRDLSLVATIVDRAGESCIDHQSDQWHNRSVLTLAGQDVLDSAVEVARASVELLEFADHVGVHPCLGVLDVVPFSPLGSAGFGERIDLSAALAARDTFCGLIADELELPCFLYGPERSLPQIRRDAFGVLAPSAGPGSPHPSAGACCVGARPNLIAYNLYLDSPDVAIARQVAWAIRSPEIRALGLWVGAQAQVSCNLVAPWKVGPAEVFDAVSAIASVSHTELVGLVPDAVLRAAPRQRWAELDLAADRTIESRLPT